MNEMQKKIQNKIRNIKKQKRSSLMHPIQSHPIQPVKISKSKMSGFTLFLSFCIIFMSIVIFASVYAQKSDVFIEPKESPNINISDRTSDYLTVLDGKNIQKQIDDIQETVSLWSHRNWLMSLALNENANIINKYHSDGYITFNSEWKMNRVPTTMDISEEEFKLFEDDIAK